jgi:fermentation-respiration switch protein FrsA (DUF1100 family)
MTPTTTTFLSGGDPVDAWHFAGAPDRPVVVMAHGLAGTKDSGLAEFATPLAAAGYHVLAFDYRGFGASGGAPRQTVSVAAQQDDYRAAVDAGQLAGRVDPTKVVLWGTSSPSPPAATTSPPSWRSPPSSTAWPPGGWPCSTTRSGRSPAPPRSAYAAAWAAPG